MSVAGRRGRREAIVPPGEWRNREGAGCDSWHISSRDAVLRSHVMPMYVLWYAEASCHGK